MTEIFSDGFESGNFDAWTGTTIGTGCTLEVQTANPHHGTYSAKCIFAAWQNIVVCYKDFSSEYSTIFARMYVRFNNFPSADTRYSRVLGFRSASAQWIATIRVYNDAGTVKWGIEYRSGANFLSQLLDSPTPTANTWYCIELKEVVHATAGETRFYLDGVEKLTQTNLDSDGVGNVKTLRCGQHSDAGLSAEMTTYFDCVVAADAYIGEEGAPPAGQQLYTLINLMGY